MGNKLGDFIWYELMTGDADAAQDFYSEVVGWTFGKAAEGDQDYRQFSIRGVNVGGLLPLTPAMAHGGARPGWFGYIGVDDVDQMAIAIKLATGRVILEPRDIPGVGRFALVADPQGAPFYVMTPVPPPGGGYSQSFAATEPRVGHCAWNELLTSDTAGALTFYHELFGWVKEGEMDMGSLGKYEFLRHDFLLGAVMPKLPDTPASTWTYYFRVPDIDTAAASTEAGGGKVLQAPYEIPGGDFAMNALDPQGAAFALVGARKK